MAARRILIRRGSETNWIGDNPLIANGELGLVTSLTPANPKYIVVGNGSDQFSQLSEDDRLVLGPVSTTKHGYMTNTDKTRLDNNYIVAGGTNSNGSYVKYSNGITICWIDELLMSDSSPVAWNGGYIIGPSTWTYPVAFTSPPAVSVFPVKNNVAGNGISVGRLTALTRGLSSLGSIFLWTSSNGSSSYISAIAMGWS